MAYPRGEYQRAWRAAMRAGLDVPTFDGGYHAGVRILEREGYLPIDTARVAAAVERVTAQARARILEAEHARAVAAGRVVELAAWRARRELPASGTVIPRGPVVRVELARFAPAARLDPGSGGVVAFEAQRAQPPFAVPGAFGVDESAPGTRGEHQQGDR